MRLRTRSSAPPAATSERLTSGIPSFAPREATIRSQASAISKPPATAKPSIAAMIGLRGGPWTMPAKPRCSTNMLSPATNAFRSMPEEKPLPAPVRVPTRRSSSSSSRSSAAPIPFAIAALTALRWSGRLSVIRRTPSSASVSTASSAMGGEPTQRARGGARVARAAASCLAWRLAEQGECGLALAAQHGEVDLDPADRARLRQDARLRLDDLGGEDAAALAERRVEPDPLEVARELLDRVDRADALDLHRDPAVVVVAAHQVDRADVRRPLGAHEPEALAAPARRGRERFLEMGLDPVLLEARVVVHGVLGVRDHLGDADLEPVVALELAHHHQAGLLLDHRRRRHPVERLVAAAVGVDEHGTVGLDHQQPQRLGQPGGQAAG